MRETAFEAQDFLMNTIVEQKIFGCAPDNIYKASLRKLHELEDLMSFYRESSEVTLLNRKAGSEAVKISDWMILVLEQAMEVSSLSDGAFSILLAPLIQLWRKSGTENKFIKAQKLPAATWSLLIIILRRVRFQ